MEKLLFKLDEIPPEGMEFTLAPDPAIYGIEQVKVLNPPGVTGWVRVVKDRRDILVKGEVQAVFEVPCNRCLTQAKSRVEGEFEYRMVPDSKSPDAEQVELTEGELEVEFYNGEEVDIRSIVAEQVYLNVPVRVLCRPDCRGLCPKCGQDLNIKDCGHRPDDGDPRWQALKNLKTNLEN